MNSKPVQQRQAERRARKKTAKKAHNVNVDEKDQPQKYNLWRPQDNGYILLREGILLKAPPKELREVGSLKESFLWHFKSTSLNISRVTSLDKCSMYEAVFKVDGVEEGFFVYPTHDQLAQIYKGFNMKKATTVLDNGAPYITDKRLRRFFREKKTRSNNNKKIQNKKKKRQRKDHKIRIALEKEKNENAPVRIDNKIAFVTPKPTIGSIKKSGMWNTQFNPKSLPKYAKIQVLIKCIDDILNSIGPANALISMELEEISKSKKCKETENEKMQDLDKIVNGTMGKSTFFFDENEVPINKLSELYFPVPRNEPDASDDNGLKVIYADLAITAVELPKNSKRQKMKKDMGSYVSDPFYREKKNELMRKSLKSREKKRSRSLDCINEEEESDIDDLFNINSDDDDDDDDDEEEEEKQQIRLKKKRCTADTSVDLVYRKLRLALENKGSVAEIPNLWYQMYEQLGSDIAIEAILKTPKYKFMSAIFN